LRLNLSTAQEVLMTKIFYSARDSHKVDSKNSDFTAKRTVKHGSEQFPLSLTVTSEERKLEIEAILNENELFANISVGEEGVEDIKELTVVLNKPKPVLLEKTPGRNDPCSCGSGNKFKKCCG
jgi:SWIM/SEC-C metal-binding protein